MSDKKTLEKINKRLKSAIAVTKQRQAKRKITPRQMAKLNTTKLWDGKP